MRKIIYFRGGSVADFVIPDDRFEAFTADAAPGVIHSEDDLGKARVVLEDFLTDNPEADAPATDLEILAACFVWNFFNSHPKDHMSIKGDVIIVDLNGDGATIEYASVDDVPLTPGN